MPSGRKDRNSGVCPTILHRLGLGINLLCFRHMSEMIVRQIKIDAEVFCANEKPGVFQGPGLHGYHAVRVILLKAD